MVGLYEQAQACTMVLPRLYLLNTVGACYILSQEAPARVSYYAAVRYTNEGSSGNIAVPVCAKIRLLNFEFTYVWRRRL